VAPDLYAGQGYASVQVLADALERAGSAETRGLRDALAATQSVETVLGRLSLVAGIGTTALLDGPLTLWLTAALAAFFLATESPPGSWRQRGWLALAGVGCGLAFLTKGFLAFAVPALVAAAYLGWQRRWRDLFRLPWPPAAAAALVAAPWSLAIHLRDPDFWRYFFGNEHVRRFLASGHAQHPQPWWLLAAATPVLLLPWSFLAPAAALGLREEAEPAARRLVRFAAVWAAVTYLFFSASSGKLLTYVLPAFPALAVLLAVGLSAATDGRPARWFRRGAAVGAAVSGLAALGVAG
jgi:4-amino-4-deoxy-L-arabinose transferase